MDSNRYIAKNAISLGAERGLCDISHTKVLESLHSLLRPYIGRSSVSKLVALVGNAPKSTPKIGLNDILSTSLKFLKMFFKAY